MKALLLALLVLVTPLTQANDNSKSLSKLEYSVLNKAHKQIKKSSWQAAQSTIKGSLQRFSSSYAKALAQQNLGQIALQLNNQPQALEHLNQARKLNALETQEQLELLHTIGQLECSLQRWKACTETLTHWGKQAPRQVTSSDHLLLAQAYSQQNRWQAVIPHIKRAIRSAKTAPKAWHKLLVAAFIQLKNWRGAANAQHDLLAVYPNQAEHWRQLVSIEIQAENPKSALASQRMGIEKQLLSQPQDYRLLAQLFLQNDLPYYAGKTLENAFKLRKLTPNAELLELQSYSWMQAKEYDRAIESLRALNHIAPNTNRRQQLAQLYMENKNWGDAEKTLLDALTHAGTRKAELQLLLGIVRTNLKQYNTARTAFQAAARHTQVADAAANWINYLEQVSPAGLTPSS